MQVGNKQIISDNVTNNNVSADGVGDTYNAIDNDVNNNCFSNDNFLVGRPYFLKYFPFYIRKIVITLDFSLLVHFSFQISEFEKEK